nr:glycosyl hydrolase family 8 [Kitasatospora sp. SID7827]
MALGTTLSTLTLGLVAFVGVPAAQAATPAHPFPSHTAYKVGVMPSASQATRDAAVTKQYDSWKSNYLVHGCASNEYYVSTKGDGDAPNNGTVSEAQGYGMNIVPLMAGYDPDAQTEFNGLWQLVKNHQDQYGLMQWKLDGSTCKYADSGTPDAATDGDLDIGYGLILADKQWGGYKTDALAWLGKIYAHDVTSDGHLKCEDDGVSTDTRPSDHMLDHLRAFAAYDTAHDWNKVISRTEAIDQSLVSNYSNGHGLLPDFVVGANGTPSPAPANYQESQPDNIVGYNSVRVPWHMGTDALLNGPSTAAFAYNDAKLWSACAKAISGGNPKNVQPHIKLSCANANVSGDTSAEEAGDSVGPSAMAAGDQAWTDAIWNQLATNPFGDHYYGETIKMLVYLVMAGDYWNPAATTTAPANDFSLALSPASGSVSAGASATVTVSTATTSGTAQSVALSASGLPAGASASFSPASVNSDSGSTLTVTTTASTPAGTYPITVKGTAASGTHSATYTLTVTTTAPANDFSLTLSPVSGSVSAGASATAAVSTATTSGTAQSVTLTATGLPAGASASFSPASVNSGSGSTLTVTTTASTPAGTYPITVKGTAASGTHSATYTLTVTTTSTGTCQPAWNPATAYVPNDQVSYNGHNYTALYWSTDVTPGSAIAWNIWQDNGTC